MFWLILRPLNFGNSSTVVTKVGLQLAKGSFHVFACVCVCGGV